jgi:Family of unknown function (DUF6084)
MPELNFQIEGAEAVPYAASPQLNLKIRITDADPQCEIHNVLLQCQIQIEPARRRYVPAEQEKMRDLFGAPSRWSQTLRPLLWSNSSIVVPSFKGDILANVPVPCTFDFNVAATKYFHGLQDGEAPICILFSGTVFYATDQGLVHVAKISWDREVNYRLPVSVWKEMMDMYYPNAAWLCLQRDVFDQIYRYKVDRGIPTWEKAIEGLLEGAGANDMRKAGV